MEKQLSSAGTCRVHNHGQRTKHPPKSKASDIQHKGDAKSRQQTIGHIYLTVVTTVLADQPGMIIFGHIADGPQDRAILRAVTHETDLGDHDFCLSRSHYTDTDPTSRERAATAGIEPGTRSRTLYQLSYRAPPPV